MFGDALLLRQFRYYLREFLSASKVSLKLEAGGTWLGPENEVAAQVLARISEGAVRADSPAVFSVPRYALAGFAALTPRGEVAGSSENGIAVAEAGLSRAFADLLVFFESIKLPVAKSMRFRMLALGEGVERRVLAHTSAGSAHVLINLGPSRLFAHWPLRAIAAEGAAERELVRAPELRVALEPLEALLYDASSCLVEVAGLDVGGVALVVLGEPVVTL